MCSRAVRHAGRCIGLVVLAGASGIAHAQEARTSMIASTGFSVETNPNNANASKGTQIAATAELRPTISVTDETTTIDLSGLAQFRQFFGGYGLEDNYGFNAQIVSRRSANLTLRGTSVFSYNQGGFNGYGRPGLSSPAVTGITPDVTALPPPTSLIDVNILGQRTRVTSIDTVIGADAKLSPFSSLSADFSARALRFKSTRFNNYNVLGTELRYDRTLDELLSVGVIGSYSKTNYLDVGQSDASSYSILGSLDRRLGARWSLSLSLGASFTNIAARASQPAVNFTALSGRLRFCWRGEYSQLCLGGQRSPQPAASGSVRVSDSIDADYSLQLSQRQRFSLTGSYARTGRGRDLVSAPGSAFASASARYDNDFDKRLTAFASASIAKVYGALSSRRTNFGAAIGLQIRIGALR